MTTEKTSKRAFVNQLLKSPGTHFMIGMGILNAETSPYIAAASGAGFLFQAAARYATHSGATLKNPVVKFFTGQQGALATNAALTLVAGCGATVLLGGSGLLAGAALAFGVANMAQALIYDGRLKFKKPITKNFALAACEVGMIGGFMMVGAHVGMGMLALTGIAGAGAALASIRSFKPQAIHPDLAYGDMLITAGFTLVQALATHNYTLAASRAFAIAGITRLAVQRAKNDGKLSIFEFERYVPSATRATTRFIGRAMGMTSHPG